MTRDQYHLMAEAGFSVVMPPCEGGGTVQANRKILDMAKDEGLGAIIADGRMPLKIAGDTHAAQTIKEIVTDYKRHPALLGYFLVDEPGADAFAGLAEVAAELRRLDPDHLVYINLFPDIASTNLNTTPSQLGTDSYAQYLDRFVQTVHPQVLSFDDYTLLRSGDRPGFFGNLREVQQAADGATPPIPFWQIVLALQHLSYRLPTENELRFEAMQTLAHGGQGIAYFTYWLPPGSSGLSGPGIMNRDGTPGPLYEPVKHVNADVRAIGKYLYGAKLLSVFQAGTVTPDGVAAPDSSLAHPAGPGDLTIGVFRGEQAHVDVLVTNRNYKSAVSTKVALDVGAHKLEQLDLATQRWKKATGTQDSDGNTVLSVDLAPAGAALIRWY